jgi:hypothetical protein
MLENNGSVGGGKLSMRPKRVSASERRKIALACWCMGSWPNRANFILMTHGLAAHLCSGGFEVVIVAYLARLVSSRSES